MNMKTTDLVSLFEQSLRGAPQENLEEVGIVVQVGDGICKIHGITNAILGEQVDFDYRLPRRHRLKGEAILSLLWH